MLRTALLATSALVLFGVWLGVLQPTADSRSAGAFAQTLDQLQKAKTMTWKGVFYEHISDQDEQNTWFRLHVSQCSYKAPGLYREVRLDEKGEPESVEVSDGSRGRKLTYFPKTKKAVLEMITPSSSDEGPFADYRKTLNAPNLQWVEKRQMPTGEVNVFRHTYRWYVGRERDWSDDVWIDAKTKQLVAAYNPGRNIYDPEHDPARDRAPGKASSYHAMGGGKEEIRYDVPLEDSLFSTEAPEGYALETKPLAHVTEQETIAYLGILAEFNDGLFPDQAYDSWAMLEKINRANKKSPKDQTPAERKLLETDRDYSHRFKTITNAPILAFFYWDSENVVPDTFRYLGKGVRLGDKERIVCWYKLQAAANPKTYRVVYGDLSVKDVLPDELPLSVQP